jgi:ubiquinone/menaquinone biosynthesis C-methylase UbiE
MPESSASSEAVYNELAVYYEQLDRVNRDGAAEAAAIEAVAVDRTNESTISLLDVGCGVATHLQHLEHTHECVGLDVNKGVAEVAADRTDDATIVRGDMHALPFENAFDCVTLLFHTLAYARSVGAMHDVLAECYRSLEPGGVLLLELMPFVPEAMPETNEIDRTVNSYTDDEVAITSVQTSRLEERTLVLEGDYLVARPGDERPTHHADTHRLTLFTVEEVLDALQMCGFDDVEYDHSRLQTGLFIANKPI